MSFVLSLFLPSFDIRTFRLKFVFRKTTTSKSFVIYFSQHSSSSSSPLLNSCFALSFFRMDQQSCCFDCNRYITPQARFPLFPLPLSPSASLSPSLSSYLYDIFFLVFFCTLTPCCYSTRIHLCFFEPKHTSRRKGKKRFEGKKR